MRRLILVLASIGFSNVALAQQSKVPESFTIVVSAKNLNVIGLALGQRPFDEVAPIISDLNRQIQEQSMPKPPETTTKQGAGDSGPSTAGPPK